MKLINRQLLKLKLQPAFNGFLMNHSAFSGFLMKHCYRPPKSLESGKYTAFMLSNNRVKLMRPRWFFWLVDKLWFKLQKVNLKLNFEEAE